jgi:hypothetical protein
VTRLDAEHTDVISPHCGKAMDQADALLQLDRPDEAPTLRFSPDRGMRAVQVRTQAFVPFGALQRRLGTVWPNDWKRQGVLSVPQERVPLA